MVHQARAHGGPSVVLVVIAGLVVVAATIGSFVIDRGFEAPGPRAGGNTEPAERTAPTNLGHVDVRLEPFAVSRGLELSLPARRIRCVCYHEASYHDALALQPLGRMRRNYNGTKFPPDEPTTKGPDYLIMSSRGRSTPATSAADVVVERRTDIFSPVSGVVRNVKRYRLYGSSLDFRLTIRPDDAPALRVVMIHLDDVRVRTGDRVEQGITVLGRPRVLPISSQTDIYVAGRRPHVHIEVVDPSRGR